MTETVESGSDLAGINRLVRAVRDVIKYVPSGDTIPDETWRNRHRNILVLLLAHVPLLFALGLYHGTESITGATIPELPLTHVVGGVGVLVGFALLSYWSRFGRRMRTGLATLGLVSSSAVMVYFSGGYIEAHFHFFVIMAVVAVYEDWLPFVVGILYVAIQHAVFGMTHPEMVYNHTAAILNPMAWAVIHAVFVLGLAAALMSHWASTERSREEALARLEQAREKTAEVESLEEKKAEIQEAKAEVERLNDHLEAKAESYSAVMAQAASGDLAVRLDPESENEAMVRIGEAFNEMIEETESTVQDIQGFAREVAAASEEANAGTREVEQASEEVSRSMQGIAEGATEQREMLEQTSTEMNEMSATIEEVAASAETVAETSRETASIAEDGDAIAEQAIEDAREVQEAIDSTVENVEALDEQMAEIGEIVELIGDIAEQTNLLALNANIEAARAGQGAGGSDGFAVVADEVKQLADETKQSASEIEGLITEAQAQTDTTVDDGRSAQRHVEESVEAVREVVDAFAKVAENTDETDSGVQGISDATDDQAASAEEAVSMVEEVAEISRTAADEVEGVSTAAAQQATSMSQVSANVRTLADQAEQLQALLSKFEVSGAPSTAEERVPESGKDVAMGDGGRVE